MPNVSVTFVFVLWALCYRGKTFLSFAFQFSIIQSSLYTERQIWNSNRKLQLKHILGDLQPSIMYHMLLPDYVLLFNLFLYMKSWNPYYSSCLFDSVWKCGNPQVLFQGHHSCQGLMFIIREIPLHGKCAKRVPLGKIFKI